MKTSILATVSLMSASFLSPALAQPATPAPATTAPAQPKKEKPKLYDEKADAKQQIAAALAKAKKENQRVLLQWGGNWCGWCIKLDEVCRTNPKLSQKLRYEYVVVHVDAGINGKNADLAKSYGAVCDGYPYLTILDADGKPVVNQSTPAFEVDGENLGAGHDPKKLLEFFTTHQAPPLDAQKVLDESLAKAKSDGKRVFLHFGAPWCPWCHRLEDWMAQPEIAAILAKDFVDVKIDTDRHTGGADVHAKYADAKKVGIPWFVFLDASGKAITDSDDTGNNLGFPYEPNEVEGFVEMLRKAAVNMTGEDIDTLAKSLHATREADKRKRSAQ